MIAVNWKAVTAGAVYAATLFAAYPLNVWHLALPFVMLAAGFTAAYYSLKWAYGSEWPDRFLAESRENVGIVVLILPIYVAARVNHWRIGDMQ